jgi:hypothetical protein
MSAETFTNTPGRWADRIVQAVGRDLERVTDHELAHHDYTFAAMALDVAKSLREEQSRLDLREFEDYPVDAKLPAWVTEQLDAADRVRNACTLTLANGTPGTAEYVLADSLLDEFRAGTIESGLIRTNGSES